MNIDLGNPVNRSHPLNRGRVVWWLGLPHQSAGSTFFDLMRKSNGAFTNTPVWDSYYRGFRTVKTVSGSSQHVSGNVPSGIAGATQATLAATVYRGDSSLTVGAGMNDGVSGSDVFSFTWWNDGNVYYDMNVGGVSHFGSFALSGVGSHRICIVQSGTNATLYLDGVSASTNSVEPVIAAVTLCSVGRDKADRFHSGSYHDYSVWNRALSSDEVVADYQMSLKGYQGAGVLNTFPRKTWASQTPAATNYGSFLPFFAA